MTASSLEEPNELVLRLTGALQHSAVKAEAKVRTKDSVRRQVRQNDAGHAICDPVKFCEQVSAVLKVCGPAFRK
jgi:hypothetical protein